MESLASEGLTGQLFGDFVSRPVEIVPVAAQAQAATEGATAAETAIEFLKTIDATGRHNLVRMCPDKTHLPVGQTFEPASWGKIEDFIKEWDGRENLYFSVNEPRPGAQNKKLEDEDIGALRAIVADVDLPGANSGDDLTALWSGVSAKLQAGPAPTIMIDSGGGVQATWVLKTKQPVDADVKAAAKAQSRGLQVTLGGDRVSDLSRVMRLPGPMNLPTAEKRAKGRTPRRATIRSTGLAVTMDQLGSYFLPIAALPESPDSDARIAAVQLELEQAHAFGARFYEDVALETRQALEALCRRSSAVAALWAGDKPRSGDASGSGYRAALAAELGRTGEFTAIGYAELCGAWPHAVQAGHDPEEKLSARALARDWVRIAEPASPQATADRWFDAEAAANSTSSTAVATSKPGSITFEGFAYLADHALETAAKPLVKGLLDCSAMSVMYGESNSGKTFVALDISFHVAAGLPWNGMRTTQGIVVYIAAEGGRGFSKRLSALRQRYQRSPAGFIALRKSVNLLKADQDLIPLIDALRAISQPIALIVIDTLSRAMAGGDENASTDMGAMVRHLDAIRAATGAHLMTVHHSGKDRAKGARGHSLLRAATDTEIEIADGKITATKQRDIERSFKSGFVLDGVTLGVDSEGDPITSATIRLLPDDVSPSGSGATEDSDRRRRIAHLGFQVLAGRPMAKVSEVIDALSSGLANEGFSTGRTRKTITAVLRDALGESGIQIEIAGQLVRIAARKDGVGPKAPFILSASRVPGEAIPSNALADGSDAPDRNIGVFQ